MKIIDVTIQKHKSHYHVCTGDNLLKDIPDLIDLSCYSSVYIITDSHVSEHYLKPVKQIFTHHVKKVHSYEFRAGEASKQLETVSLIYRDMANQQIDRKALIVNLGGGVVSDLGGYVAASYLRGVSFMNISTTLEGMVDASVGGKTGVNLGTLKNYVGAFAQPKLVICDVCTLKTLPKRAFLQGYAEVIKHGLIADPSYFEDAVRTNPLKMTEHELVEIISKSVEIKTLIVQQDETEQGSRKLLNFGHTIGHVLESLSMESENPLFHGEAVAIGLIAESFICKATGMITESDFRKIEDGIRDVGLPVRYRNGNVHDIFETLLTDKKAEQGHIKWTLLSGIGRGEFNVSVDEKFVKEAIEYILI